MSKSKAEKILKVWGELQGAKDRLNDLRAVSIETPMHGEVLRAIMATNAALTACRVAYEEATRPVAAISAIHRHAEG